MQLCLMNLHVSIKLGPLRASQSQDELDQTDAKVDRTKIEQQKSHTSRGRERV